jgi:hypothetical protein
MSVPSWKSTVTSTRPYLDTERSMRWFGNAQHLDLDGHRDAALDFLGRHAGRLHDDLDLRAGHVREGVDRQVA